MAENDEVVENEVTDSPEDIAAAGKMGWSPKEKYRGDPDRWVDAKEYLERANTVLPIVKQQKAQLEQEVAELRSRDVAREGEMKAIKAALKAVEDSQDESLAEQVTATKAELEEQIAAASEAGDHRRMAKLTVDLTELITAEKVKAARPPAREETEVPASAPVTPEHKAWMAENSDWYGTEKDKTRTAIAFGHVIAAEGLTGKAFYTELDKRMTRYYGDGAQPRGESKVENGRPSGENNSGGEEAAKGFSTLPRDAKDTCDRLAKKMVGEGKPHKDIKSWRASYTRQYLAQEAR